MPKFTIFLFTIAYIGRGVTYFFWIASLNALSASQEERKGLLSTA